MDLPDTKLLKNLANACRKAGIKSFKGFGFEFTLAEVIPKAPRVKANTTEVDTNQPIETNGFSPEDMLYWSSGLPDQVAQESKE